MTDTVTLSERDETTGRFLPGNSGFGGRKPGSRNLLSTQFLDDLRDAWAVHGKAALARCAEQSPEQFCQLVSRLLPSKAELDVQVAPFADATSVLEAFRMCSAAVNGDSERVIRGLRKHVPHLLEHITDDGR